MNNIKADNKLFFWLSFVGDEGFRGACFVEATDIIAAVREAHRLGCNPGGEVCGHGPIPIGDDEAGPWKNRLLSRAECAEFDRVICGYEAEVN